MTKAQKTTRATQRTTPRTTTREADVDVGAVANDVWLVGRLSADPTTTELPSGDVLVTMRISVPRQPGRTTATPARQRSDSVPCTVWAARVRRSVSTWRAGDLVEVSGSIRCRFYQAGGATRSRVEVEVSAGRIIRRSSAA